MIPCHRLAMRVPHHLRLWLLLAALISSYHLDAWHKLQLGWSEPRIRSLADGGIESIVAAQSLAADSPVTIGR